MGLVMKINEMFRFNDGSTVLVGIIDEGPGFIGPCEVELIVDGVPQGMLSLMGERTAGRRGQRAVQTRSTVDIESIRGRAIQLRSRDI